MKLTTDLAAPAFSVKDIFGRLIDLNDYRNKKIFIGFFRHAGCPFCNIRVHALMKVFDELKSKGLEMIFFFESKENVLLRSSFHKEVSPVPLISDPQKKIYDAYGLETSMYKSTVSHLTTFVQTAFKASKAGVPIHLMSGGESLSTMPAEFLVGEGLVIKEVLYSDRLNDRMDIQRIRKFAESGM